MFINIALTLYQCVSLLYMLIIPIGMLLGLIWLAAKVLKAFVRSIAK